MRKVFLFLLGVIATVAIFASFASGLSIHQNHREKILHTNIPINSGSPGASNYQIGTGIYDVTGPAAEEGMMGYAMVNQRTAGIHFRLRARAFIIADNQGRRIAFVNVDLCMTMQSVKLTVIQKLQEIYGDLYTNENVVISGTHTHSGPGGFSWYALYDMTTFGFSRQNFDCIVNGIVEAIVRAHESMSKGGRILVNQGLLDHSNINRSPTAYLANPPEERAKYDTDTDHLMTVLRFEDETGAERGMLSFFAVHCTSMNNTNKLISGDNKGYASYLFEKYKNGNDSLPGFGPFIAAFGQSNEGDVSPNTEGPFCPNGERCAPDSTCNGRNEGCKARGPGKDMFQSTEIIGRNQFEKALELYETASVILDGPVDYRHQFVQMTNVTVLPEFSGLDYNVTTCRAAMGYSFAAGTTDGPGEFDFRQGQNTSNPFWNFISQFIAKPTPDQIACQAPKPILIDVGQTKPYPWTPDVVPLQIVRVGQLFIIAVPGEFTTMSGRRLRDTVKRTLIASGAADENAIVVIAGLANTYTGYVATYEEYTVQRYEGASTIFGPHTLAAYQQLFANIAESLGTGKPLDPGPTPRNLSEHQLNFNPPVIVDGHPIGGYFGMIHTDVEPSYTRGGESVATVVFYGANPRNDLMTQDTFLTVERLNSDGSTWTVVATDGDWETRFMWKRHLIDQSLITIEWYIPEWAEPGQYRIQHFGVAKSLLGRLTPYTGTSSTFTVV